MRRVIKEVKGLYIWIHIIRKGHKNFVIEYFYNLGSVSKQVYKEFSYESFDYVNSDGKRRGKK